MTAVKRESWIDALKGIAILCVVLGHVLDGALGKKLFQDSGWIYILYRLIYSFHMPLFFYLSGFVFSRAFLKNKVNLIGGGYKYVWNLFLLYVFWSGFMYLFKLIFSGTVNVVYRENLLYCLAFAPVDPYWYFITLLYYYLFGFFVMRRIIEKKEILAVLFCILGMISLFLPCLLPLEDRRANFGYRIMYHLIFFFCGIVSEYRTARKESENNRSAVICAALAVAVSVVICGAGLYKISFFRLPAAMIIIALLTETAKKTAVVRDCKWLRYMGDKSLYIYVLHNYFTVLFRVIYLHLGLAIPSGFYVFGNLVLTLFCCAIAERAAGYFWPLDIVFRPVKTYRRIKGEAKV